MAPTTMAGLLDRITEWAEGVDDVRTVALVGSQARTETPADEYSDADVILVTTDPHRYLDDGAWLSEIAPYGLTMVEPAAIGGGMERRAIFDPGLAVDFAIVPPELIAVAATLPDIQDIFQRGFRVLVDKDGIAAEVDAARTEPPPIAPPTASEFENVVGDFWYHAVFAARKCARGELWLATSGVNSYLAGLLLKMMQWQARAAGRDPWFRGRFVERWVDSDVARLLPQVFARYESADVARAIPAMGDAFRTAALKVAEQLDFVYQEDADAYASKLVREALAKVTS